MKNQTKQTKNRHNIGYRDFWCWFEDEGEESALLISAFNINEAAEKFVENAAKRDPEVLNLLPCVVVVDGAQGRKRVSVNIGFYGDILEEK